MRRIFVGLLAAVCWASALSASAQSPVSLACAASTGSVTYYLIVDYANATVTLRDWGTYVAQITAREITWTGQAQTFYRLERETGRWEIHNPDGGLAVLQCQRGEPIQRF